MFVKGLVVTALLASTPIAYVATQDPRAEAPKSESAMQRLREQQQQTLEELARARAELAAARADLQRLEKQLDRALDQVERQFEPQRERNCSPSRNRALMSHYQWLRDEGHAERAAAALAKVVERAGNDQNQRNGVAWDLMTDKETVGKCDDVALAIAQKMEQNGAHEPHHLDTMALANFLCGRIEKAIELEQKAIAAGGNGDDFRRRLRTYEAARDAVARSQNVATAVGPKLVATADVRDDVRADVRDDVRE